MLFTFQFIKQVNLISSAGLLFDIIGVFILFRHAPPITHQLSKRTLDELAKFGINSGMWAGNMQLERTLRKEKKWSQIGIKFVFIGFVLQLLSTFFLCSLGTK